MERSLSEAEGKSEVDSDIRSLNTQQTTTFPEQLALSEVDGEQKGKSEALSSAPLRQQYLYLETQ